MLVFVCGELLLIDWVVLKVLFDSLCVVVEVYVQGFQVCWQCEVCGGELLCNCDILVGIVFNLVENVIQVCGFELCLKVYFYVCVDSLCFSVSDNGLGMDLVILVCLGEFFFIIKIIGIGFGLVVVKVVVCVYQG